MIQNLNIAATSLQSCPTLCDPIDGNPPGSPVPGSLQARTLDWVAISFSNAWKWKVKVKLLSCVWLLVTPWTVVHQAPLSMGFSRQENWSGVPLSSPFHAKMGTIKDKNSMDLTEAEDIKNRLQEYTEELHKKGLNDPDNPNGVVTHLEPDILEC